MPYQLLLIFSFVLLSVGCQKDNRPQSEIDEEKILAYLEENNKTATRHETGLYYEIITPGGSEKPAPSNEVRVKYKGTLLNGNVFDETTGSETRNFILRTLIPAWQIGIPLVGRGGKAILYAPSALAYGSQRLADIPANSVLIFEIELVDFQ